MPTYYKPGSRKGNRTWVVRGYVDGRQYEIATDATHKRGEGGAEATWEAFKARIRAERRRSVDRETATFLDAARLYRAQKPVSRNDARYLDRLEAELGAERLADITVGRIHAAAAAIYPAAKPQTRNRQAVRPAAAVLHHAAGDPKLCDWLRVPLLPEEEPERPLLYPEQVQVAVAAARRRRDKELVALLLTLQLQGWRISETLALTRDRIDWRAGEVVRRVDKSRRWRRTGVVPAVLRAWKGLPERPDGRLFSYAARHDVYKAIDGLGLDLHVRPHMARRGLATALKDAGADLDDIMRAVGWEDPKSARVYVRDDPARARATLGRIRGRIRGSGGPRRKAAKK